MRLTEIVEIKGTIELMSGLHIGAGDSEMHIGGTDSPVIKNPHTHLPYIPGSSLKGKIRSLLEWHYGLVEYSGGKPFGFNHLERLEDDERRKAQGLNLIRLFGISGGDKLSEEDAKENGIGLTRLAFRDCNPEQTWVDGVQERNLLLTETKFENCINRIAGTAEHPRNFERVPAGGRFEFALSMKVLDSDRAEALLSMLLTGLKLLELDALGGSGSRGYGRLKFHLQGELQQQLEAIDPFTEAAA